MRKIFFTTLILIFVFFFTSAQGLEIKYEDTEGNAILKRKYNNILDLRKNLPLERTTDTSIVYYLKKREIISNVSTENFGLLRDYIVAIDSSYDSSKDKIVIQYYPGQDPCNSTGNKEYMLKSDFYFIKKINRIKK